MLTFGESGLRVGIILKNFLQLKFPNRFFKRVYTLLLCHLFLLLGITHSANTLPIIKYSPSLLKIMS